MTLTEAKRTFADLMQKARGGSLTERDRSRLTQARQLLRKARRPAMNPRRVKRRARNPIGEAQRRGMALNPGRSTIQNLGPAMEVRYRRRVGSQPGYYKHEIESRHAGVYTVNTGWVYVTGKSILISEHKPRVR